MADTEAAVRTVQRELGFPGVERLVRAIRARNIGDELSAKDLRAIVTRLSTQESSKQVLAPPPPYDGKIAARVIDDRWACDLISFVQRPHKTAHTGTYRYVLIAQDIFSRKIWTEPLSTNANLTAEFLQFLGNIGRKPRQLVTDKESIFLSHEFQRMLREEGIDHQVKTALNDISTLDAAIGRLKEILSILAAQPGGDTGWYENLPDATAAFNKNENDYLGTGNAPADVAGDDGLRFELRRKNVKFMERNNDKAKERRERLTARGAFRTFLEPLSYKKRRKGMPNWSEAAFGVQSVSDNLVQDASGETHETRLVQAVPKESTAITFPAYFAGGSAQVDARRRAVMDPYVPILLAHMRTMPLNEMTVNLAGRFLKDKGDFTRDLRLQKMGKQGVVQFLRLYPDKFKVEQRGRVPFVKDANPVPPPPPAAAAFPTYPERVAGFRRLRPAR
jgi:hypothetical protein